MEFVDYEKSIDIAVIPAVEHLSESGTNEPEYTPCNRLPKRNRGGQKNNQNARKHGTYSDSMTPAEQNEFMEIIRSEKLNPQLAWYRVKLKTLLHEDPGNTRAVRAAVGRIVEYYRKEMNLSRTKTEIIRTVLENIMTQCASKLSDTE